MLLLYQVGAGGLKALAAAKAPMTMDEILEVRQCVTCAAFAPPAACDVLVVEVIIL